MYAHVTTFQLTPVIASVYIIPICNRLQLGISHCRLAVVLYGNTPQLPPNVLCEIARNSSDAQMIVITRSLGLGVGRLPLIAQMRHAGDNRRHWRL